MKAADLQRVREIAAGLKGKTAQDVLLEAIAPFAEVAVNIGVGDSAAVASPSAFRDACLRAWLVWSITDPAAMKTLALGDPELSALLEKTRADHAALEDMARSMAASAQKDWAEASRLHAAAIQSNVARIARDGGFWLWGLATGLVLALNGVAA